MAFRMKTVLALLVGFLFLIALWVWSGYNSLVTMQETVKNSWAQVETTYQRRVDLIPNLVNTVKGAANFEQSTLQAVTEARTKWMAAPDRASKLEAAQGAESAIARLLVTMEAYPQLKATQAFTDLMAQLEGTENRINVARRDYNDAVMKYNVGVRRFPRNVLAGFFGFDQEKPFEAAPGSENAPTVDFGTTK
ncbi:MAG: LemA family protein [Candidatus Peribacteraceae bacterium]|nr:LemA family protein [Candidatus Peribacteraceae bacterium]MDD5074649.1 LemA family protein [Candidatus Peribacteraceae bacterium]